MAFEGDIQTYAPTEVDEVGKIILKARAVLSNPNAWCKASMQKGDAVCLLGAMGFKKRGQDGFSPPSPAAREAGHRLLALIPERYNYIGMRSKWAPIWRFNDATENQHADILALLDRATKPNSTAQGD